MQDIKSDLIGCGEDYYDLGAFSRRITTHSTHAQAWFDRGLIWCYAFNHEEAAACFEKAISLDPQCAMAYWGLAYSLGPNYNKPWEFFDEQELEKTVDRTHAAVSQAKANDTKASPVERALIKALQARYPARHPAKESSIWSQEYAKAMESVYLDFSADLDVAALYADALMNLTPWALWDLRTGKPQAGARTLEVKTVLDRALAQTGGMSHPGLLHLYIHLMEMSGSPESALTVADHLRGLVPDAGHLNHMPSHLDVLCGHYRRAIASNQDAMRADEKFLARAGPLNFYTLYRCHDYHFCIYAAMFSGQSKVALETSARLVASVPEALLRIQSPPMADWLEGFLSVRIHVLIRFGLWDDILSLPFPEDKTLYSVTTAMTHYAHGIALSATCRVSEAQTQLDLLHQAITRIPSSRTLFNNKCIDLLAIGAEMLTAELEYRRQNHALAFEHLRRATQLDDSLPYDEPWGWMQPTRHAYGALLLEQGLVEEAAAVYSADLGFDESLPRAQRHPGNVWALHGYHECLVRLGRDGEAKIVGATLRIALGTADVPVKASCFCRLEAVGAGTVVVDAGDEGACCASSAP